MNTNNKLEGEIAAEEAAQYLANLLGKTVAGFHPTQVDDIPSEIILDELLSGKRKVTKLNIESEFSKKSPTIGPYVILSGLIKGEKYQQEMIMAQISSKHFRINSFAQYLFKLIIDQLQEFQQIFVERIQGMIMDFGPSILGEELNGISKLGVYHAWFQILSINPTDVQIQQAMKIMLKESQSQSTGQ